MYRYSDDLLNQDLIPDRMYSARHARKTGKRALLSDKRLSWHKRDDTSVAFIPRSSCPPSGPFRSGLLLVMPGCQPKPIFDTVPVVLRDALR